MALPNYDATKHHVGLGPTGSVKGFLIDGGYQRSAQRFGSPSEFGGERDQLEPSVLSRWTQDDFSGGGGEDLWGDDAAMFARSKNLLPALIEKTARTVPPLVYFQGAGAVAVRRVPGGLPDPQDDWDAGLGLFATGGKKIAVVDQDEVRYFDAETGAVVSGTDPAAEIQCATHDPADNKVYIIAKRKSDGMKRLGYVTAGAGLTYIHDFGTALNNNDAVGIEVTSGRDVIVVFGGPPTLYLLDVNDARDDATSTRIGRVPGQWRDAVSYNGMTYILLTDTEQTTQVVAWDGSQVLPVHVFPYNFLGRAIAEYGGRLYVCGSVADITDDDRYAALYELTGSSERLVYSSADQARAGLTVPTKFYEMVSHEGKLFVGSDIGYLMAYDLTRDGLWSEIEIRSDTGTRTLEARRLLSTREKLFAWCYDPNRTDAEDGFYRMATSDADLTDPTPDVTYECELETSDFAPEPSRQKRLSELVVLTRAAAATPATPTMEYSFNGGDTWTSVSGSSTVNGRFRETTFDLTDLTVTKVVRFRFTLPKTTVGYEEFVAFTMNFLMLDSNKRTWRFTVNGADNVEQLDGVTLDQDLGTMDDTLWGWKENATLLEFTDVNGETRKVQLTDISTTSPIVGEFLADGSRESFYSLALTEV